MEEEKKEEAVQVEEKKNEILPVEEIPEEKGTDVPPTIVENAEKTQVEEKEDVEEKVLEPEVEKEVEAEDKNETVVLDECDEVDADEDIDGEDVDGDVDIDEEVHEEDDASSSSSAVPEEREDGDGEEEKEETKKLDDDEDKRNPQYIPKKGMFYEHDDRTADVDEDEASAANDKKPKKGKVWEDVDLWRHDLYDDDEQGPKSTQELIDTYGYDIRREEGPPKARRRRRYGKGPNKYQRSWEDEGAYIKTSTGFRGRRINKNFVKKDEDFPELPSKEVENPKPAEVKAQKKVQISNKVTEFKDSTPVTNLETKQQVKESPGEKQFAYRGGRGGSSRGRGGRGRFRPGTGRAMNSNTQSKPRRNDEEDIAALAQHFSEAVINIDKNVIARSTNNELPPEKGSKSVPQPSHKHEVSKSKQAHHHPPQQSHVQQLPQTQVQLQQQQNQQQESRSKRYSAQRQRSLPQSNPHPQQQPQQQPQPQPQPQQPQQQPPQQPVVQQQFMPQQPQQQIPPPTFYPQQQHGGCVDAPAPGGMPQNYPGMQVVAFLPPPPHPPPAQPGFPPPPLYVSPQYLPSPTMAVQPGPTEVYQGSGITFYNTQTQMARPTQLSRRVKLAIPIISPNESQAES